MTTTTTPKQLFDVSTMTEAALAAFLGVTDSADLTVADLASMSPDAVREMNARHVQCSRLARRNRMVTELAHQEERPGAGSYSPGTIARAHHSEGWTPDAAYALAEQYEADYGPASGCLGGRASNAPWNA